MYMFSLQPASALPLQGQALVQASVQVHDLEMLWSRAAVQALVPFLALELVQGQGLVKMWVLGPVHWETSAKTATGVLRHVYMYSLLTKTIRLHIHIHQVLVYTIHILVCKNQVLGKISNISIFPKVTGSFFHSAWTVEAGRQGPKWLTSVLCESNSNYSS